ncbi:T9SS type A sorting domain-containing protein [Hymenobacter canadensis]|uniref:T9SS type A sorting domain-containing protein n=1 Tax=Hymenobacter canadensis TaxID=2999067 RepID=A0ABY7LT64_9BACT|nr:T9SS type A sorting domain-containing protein [Hymenobacter canadensis]WBA42676.1 T9SS type A sorting domain-containing protein [Hymenobacter canadensis]
MHKQLLFLSAFLAVGATAQAQWVNQPVTNSTPDHVNLAISAVDANVAWTTVAGGEEFYSQLFSRTINGGTTWTTTAIPGLTPNDLVTGIYAQSATTAWVTVAADFVGPGRILRTTDGGANWVTQTTATQFAGNNSFPTVVRFFDALNGVAVGNPNNGRFEIYTTTNAGATWTTIPAANAPQAQGVEDLVPGIPVIAQAGNSIWVGTDEGRILRSTDRGLTWTVAATGLEFLEAVAFRDALNGLALDEDGNYVRTTDGGATWARISPTGPVHTIGLDNVPGTRTYVSTGFGAYGPGSSYSTDDGQTWVAIESTVNHVLVDFVSPSVGWSGGLRVDANGDADGGNGMNKYTGITLATNAALAARLGISAFPNPAPDGRFLVRAAGLKAATPARVLDGLGRTVLAQTWTSPALAPLALDLSQQTAGVYVLELTTPDGLVRQKLVVR